MYQNMTICSKLTTYYDEMLYCTVKRNRIKIVYGDSNIASFIQRTLYRTRCRQYLRFRDF